MSYDYPADGHIHVCVRVRDVATVPGMSVCQSSAQRSARERLKEAQRICVSTVENVVVLHDPKFIDDASCVARDADGVVQFLTARCSAKDRRLVRKLLTSTATANCFEFDRCLNSMDATTMMQMPVIRNSDFIRPPERDTQEDVYLSTAVHAVSAAVEGINSCVFAYGQTGSGKTFTLFGDTTAIQRDSGVVPRTIEDVFQRLEDIKRESQNNGHVEYLYRVQLSFFEIYQNEVYCLFSRKGPLRVSFVRDPNGKEEQMVIHELRQHVLTSAEKSYPLVELGLRRRQTGETGMNARSSRSHAVLQLRVTQWRTNRVTKESMELNATINLVDLAGSERQRTAKAEGKSRDEGIQINQSLAALARVINEISRGSKYVNYRDSLLTMVLKENLGGNSKTFMIATIAPVAFCYQESCATLQYAKSVRKIRNRPVVNKTFQTRLNLLELNAVLKKENEQLKQHIDNLLRNVDANIDDTDTDAVNDFAQPEKAMGMAMGCGAVIKSNRRTTPTEAVLAVPAAGAVPLIVTGHRKYTTAAGIGAFCVVGDKIGVTSLTMEIVQFRLADLLCGVREPTRMQLRLDVGKDYGVVEFERVSQRSFEQHYWVRYIAPTGDAATLNGTVDCQFNGRSLNTGDRQQLTHGDVICVYLDGVDDDSEQSLLSFHYVDIHTFSRRGDVNTGFTASDLMAVSPFDDAQSRDAVEQLQREKTKLMDMLQEKERTIEYQCQREAESRSRMASLANYHHWEKNGSPSPNPVRSLESLGMNAFATTPLQANAAARAYHHTSATPTLSSARSKDSKGFKDGMYGNEFSYRPVPAHTSAMEDLMRRLEELERSASPECKPPCSAVMEGGPVPQILLSASKRSETLEVSESEEDDNDFTVNQSELGATLMVEGQKAFDVSATALVTGGGEDRPLAAGELPQETFANSDLERLGKMHLYMATSDGVCERHRAARRERLLCERILSLEQTLEDLRGEMQLMESKLRVANDVNIDHELCEVQLKEEMAETSKMLHDVTEENRALQRDVNSLETFLNRTEEALAEATSINEAELEKRFISMSQEIDALKKMARMWKRRAMKRVAWGLGDEKSDEEMTNTREELSRNDLHEEDTAAEAVAALEATVTGLEDKNLRLIDEINTREAQLQDYKDLVERLRQEKERLETEAKRTDEKTPKEEETQKFNTVYKQKCKELEMAEKEYEDAGEKLQTAVRKKTVVKKKSMKSNDMLMKEQRRAIEEHQDECKKLRTALKSKDEELNTVLQIMRGCVNNAEMNGLMSDKDLRKRVEELIEESMKNCTGSSGFSVFPSDFQFSGEVIALIRVCLRIMMDRLKIELYVLNRQSLHKLGLLVPAVQLRPEAQFHFFMHELRGVVAEIAGKPQRIGAKWSIEESDVLSGLVDHRRRRAGNALNGLLIWYDHWDLAPKTEHVFYVELIRNTERVMQLARLVRQESLVNTNATSSLRHILPERSGTFDVPCTPKSSKDTGVAESRRILEKLTAETKSSNLARVVSNGQFSSAAGVFQRSRTTASILFSPHKFEKASSLFPGATTALTAKGTTTGRYHLFTERGQGKEETKFGRRATALVVPATENDIAFAASSTFVPHDSTFNFKRQMTLRNTADAEPPKQAAKGARFARSKTDVAAAGAAMRGSGHRRSLHALTPGRSVNTCAERGKKKQTTKTASSSDMFCRTQTSQFARTSTSALPQLSTRISGRRLSTMRPNHGAEAVCSPKPSTPSAASSGSFYDPRVLKKLKQRSVSEGNEMTRLTSSTAVSASVMPLSTPKRAGAGSGGVAATSTTPSTSRSSSFPLPRPQVQGRPIVPKLSLGGITK